MKSAATQRKQASRKSAKSALPMDPSSRMPLKSVSREAETPSKGSPHLQWTFLTNHSHVLVLLSRNPSVVLREVALQVGITERAVQRIIADLEAGGVIEREKIGRQNHYRILTGQPLRHPVEAHRSIGELLALLNTSN